MLPILNNDSKSRLSGLMQLCFLLSSYFFGLVFAASIIQSIIGDDGLSTVYNIRVSNIIQGLFLFLIPIIIYAALFADTKGQFLVKSSINKKTLLLSILLIFCLQAFIETVNHYNNLITLPESMTALDDFFKQTKESGEKTLKLVFADKSLNSLFINILVIAVLPGIVEELFFRGCMQRSMQRVSDNVHVAIWMTAVIFSLMHFQLAGFFPRIILGAVLGYLYVWTKNIWIPIIVHIIHNATIVVVMQMFLDTNFYKQISISDYSLSNAGIATLISFVASVGLMILIYKNRAGHLDKNQ